MRIFAEAYPDFLQAGPAKLDKSIVQPLAAQIQTTDNQHKSIMQVSLAQLTWYHHITLLDKVKNKETRYFYIRKTLENGWQSYILDYGSIDRFGLGYNMLLAIWKRWK